MNNTNLFDDEILKLSALHALQEVDDDDDDEEAYFDSFGEFDDDDDEESFDDDDDEVYFDAFGEEDDDDDEESYAEGAGMADEFGERRRRRWRRRSFRRPRYRRRRTKRLKGVRGSRSTTLRSRTGQRMKVRFGKSFATSAEVNKLIKDTEKKFAAAMKERKANHDRLSKQIAKATRELDGKVSTLRKSVKKMEKQGQTSSLLSLLQGPPKVETIKFSGDDIPDEIKEKALQAEVTFKKQDMLLPLMLSGGLGGGSGDDTLILALALGNRN